MIVQIEADINHWTQEFMINDPSFNTYSVKRIIVVGEKSVSQDGEIKNKTG
jgi:hypothetical protein